MLRHSRFYQLLFQRHKSNLLDFEICTQSDIGKTFYPFFAFAMLERPRSENGLNDTRYLLLQNNSFEATKNKARENWRTWLTL